MHVAAKRTLRAMSWLFMQSLVVGKSIARNVLATWPSCVREATTPALVKTAFMHLMQPSTYGAQSKSPKVIVMILSTTEHSS